MLSRSVYSRSNLYLNQKLVRLRGETASLFVHYWGAKPQHKGNTPHTHAFFEICYVAEGEGEYFQDGVTYPLRAGTLYCSRPGSRHFIRSEAGMVLYFLAIEPIEAESGEAFLSDYRLLCDLPHLFIPNAERTAPGLIWQALLLQAAEPEESYGEAAEQLAYTLVLSCVSLLLRRRLSVDPGQNETRLELQGTVKQALEYIQARLSRKIALADVAESLHLSERQLSRLLSEQLGQSFSSLVKTERVKRAAYLLGYTDLPLKRIAEETGFESIHYFTQVFTREMGTPPSQFRKTGLQPETVDASIHSYLEKVAKRYQRETDG